LVTSTVGGEGKSFVASNLGLTFALTGKKVILVGLDLRKPKMEVYLEGRPRSEKGVSNYLKNEAPLNQLIQTFERLPNLHYIDCGTIPRNPSELMMTDKMRSMFEYLWKHYDYVIVDSAPIGAVADSLLLKEYVSQTIVVTRYGYSTTAHLRFMSEVHNERKLPNMHILLNGLRQERGNFYNYGYYSSRYYQEQEGLWVRIKGWFKGEKSEQEQPESQSAVRQRLSDSHEAVETSNGIGNGTAAMSNGENDQITKKKDEPTTI